MLKRHLFQNKLCLGLITLPGLMLITHKIYASNTTHFFKSWDRLAINKTISGNFKSAAFIELRLGNKQNLYQSSIYNISLGYQYTSDLSFWMAYQLHNNLISSTNRSINENRIFQQINWRYQQFSSRFRIEERFFENRDDTLYRLRLRAGYTFSQVNILSSRMFFDDEVLLRLNHPSWTGASTLDQNRFRLGFKKTLEGAHKLTFGYMNLYAQGSRSNSMSHIVFITYTIT